MFNEIDYDFNVAEQAEKCVNWARDYMNNINPNGIAVIGISGGLDSTVALLGCVAAMDYLKLDYSHIHAITMPCFGTTSRTKSNAYLLCEKLGVSVKEIDIKNAVSVHLNDIGHEIANDVTFENAQARERTQILMDYCNQVKGIVIGTGDLSEIALGWSTYNGDHMSMYAVNNTFTKTFIKEIANTYPEIKINLYLFVNGENRLNPFNLSQSSLNSND